jgi:alpha-L-fucosidase
MDQYGAAIYGTTASPFPKLPWGRCTKKLSAGGGTLFLHVFNWPADGRLLVPGLQSAVGTPRLLGGAVLKAETTDEGVVLHLPAAAPNAIASVIELPFTGELSVVKQLLQPGPTGVLTLDPATADTTGSLQVEEKDGKSNLGFWTDANSTATWTFNLKQAGSYRISTEVAGTGPSAFTVACGAARLEAAVSVAAGYESFTKVELGTLALGAGEQKLVLTPAPGRWNAINLRALTLTPAP